MSPPNPRPHGEAFYRKVLQQSADITSVLAPDGTRVFVSSGVRAVLGFSEEEALSLEVGESTHPEDRERVQATFRHLLKTPGAHDRIRFRQRRKDGTWVLVDAVVQNACDDPDVGGVVVTTRDVTEQVLLEEQFFQAQKLESVGRLAGGVAHDFNNLLTVIASCVELLQDQVPAEQGELVEEIGQAAERAGVLTRQLLAFARKGVASPELLDLSEQVRVSERLLKRILGEEIELVTQLEPAPWPTLCDAGQLDQVLMNLAVNARDAMPSGGRLTIETANVPAHDGLMDRVRLTVRDTGIGLTEEVRQHLFEPFFTTKPAGKGTGLGLATVHGIVRQSGGELEVHSEPGRGAAFSVLLPRSQGTVSVRERQREPVRDSANAAVVLLVEDDVSVRQLTERVLLGAGFQVLPAIDVDSARRLLADRTQAVDLVVTDAVLPDGDGAQVAAQARAQQPGVPVLFVSGHPPGRISSGSSELDLLRKPYTPTMLLARVQEALGRRVK